ncbi:MAG: glycosyltransferase family A protein [Candidatus Dependentiae bacterium]
MKKTLIFCTLIHAFSLFSYEEKPMVIVIPSYNNAQWYERNLNSACFQNYTNYRIIYIDDCSPDGTGSLVKSYIDKHNLHEKVTLICNETNQGAMANHYKAVWMCDDDEIVIHLDGDDWLAHNDVLKRVNQEYQDSEVWLTYGQFERHPDGKLGYCRQMPRAVIQRNVFREYDWMTSHLRTFYAGLFKQIKLRDFVHDGNYFSITCDMAMMMPLLELAGSHMRFIPDVLYVYNEETPINDYKKNVIYQLHCDRVIRSSPKYLPATNYITSKRSMDPIDIVIFSLNPTDLHAILTEIENSALPIQDVVVLTEEPHASSVLALQSTFPTVDFVTFNQEGSLCQFLDWMCQNSGYLLLTTDTFVLTEAIPLVDAVNALEATKALSFNFSLGDDVTGTHLLKREMKKPLFTQTPDGFYAWQFNQAELDWRQPFAWTMNLVRKSDIKKILDGACCQNFNDLYRLLNMSFVDLNQMGLCCKRSHVHKRKKVPDFLAPLLKLGYKVNQQGNYLVKI